MFHQSVYPELRVYLDKQMHVVGQDFQSNDLGSISQSRLMYPMEETLGNLIHQHFTTVHKPYIPMPEGKGLYGSPR